MSRVHIYMALHAYTYSIISLVASAQNKTSIAHYYKHAITSPYDQHQEAELSSCRISGSMEKKKPAASNYLCLAPIFAACVPSAKQQSGADDAARNRLSFSFTNKNHAVGKDGRQHPEPEEHQYSDSIIDPAASIVAKKDARQHCAIIVGTIFGSRGGRVTFCVQRDPAVPPPFLFELSVPMQSIAAEMGSGLLRIALECHRSSATDGRSKSVWTASCNGRDVGHAMRRPPTDWERGVLESMRAMTTGVGALPPATAQEERSGEEVLYMRATYERIVGSKDAVSYHLISPRTAGGSPPQELSVFLLRTRGE
jgi:uncharacterized protein (TIGR01570 family)